MASRPSDRSTRRPAPEPDAYQPQPRRTGGSQRMGLGETVIKAFIRSIGSSIGRILVRTITGRMR